MTAVLVQGHVSSGFEPVADAFADNFRHRGDTAASCVVYAQGAPVVDIWAGRTARGAWTRGARTGVFSVSKGVTTVCLLMAAERGLIDLDAPVAKYWPEFAENGKEATTVRHLLAHRAGLVAPEADLGTFGSTGDFYPMANEAGDAQDAVAWLRTQPWFDGRLATSGGSYVGWTQWALLMDPPSELRTCLIAVGPHDMHDAVYGAGAFQVGDFLAWAEMLANQERFTGLRAIARTLTLKRRLAPVFDALPLADAADEATAQRTPWFREWLTTADPGDPLWDRLKLDEALQRANVPVRLTAGWQDLFLDQNLRQYQALRARGVDVSLTVGPWTHNELGQKGMGRLLRGNLAWLRTHLADEAPAQPRSVPPVEVYVTGQGAWRHLDEWPPAAGETVRYLRPGGKLLADEPSGGGAPSTYVYDPAHPTPTLGGPVLTLDGGSKDNAKLESRPDVLTFTTDPLTAPLDIMGTPVVELAHTRSNPHADVFVRLCDVDLEGVSRNFAEGLLRLDPTSPLDQVLTVRVRLDACAHQVKGGHQIRLLIAGGSHPRFARNEGTGELPGTGSELRPCTHTVHHDSGAVSRVILPTPSG